MCQLREVPPVGQHPEHLSTDRDRTYGPLVAHVATASGIDRVCTAYRAPKMNARCERLLGSVRRACLDHLLIRGERHLERVLRAYGCYFNEERPHPGIAQRVPDVPRRPRPLGAAGGGVQARPIVGRLHHAYHRAA